MTSPLRHASATGAVVDRHETNVVLLGRVLNLELASRSLSHPGGGLRIGQELPHFSFQIVGIARVEKQAGLAVRDRLGHGAHP